MTARSFGSWVLGEELGEGGMGTVFRAHRQDAPSVEGALKVIRSGRADGSLRARFLREARLLSRLRHPCIVRVLDYELGADTAWMVMELVDGAPLNELVGPLPPDEAAAVALQLTLALVEAHRAGVFHRDIKPSNVLLRADGRLVLIDFGIAVEEGATRYTATGENSPATVMYAPPEWAGSSPPAPGLWDVWAVGALLNELLTGRPPVDVDLHGTPVQQLGRLVMAKLDAKACDPGDRVGARLRRIVIDATAPDPSERIGSMNELAVRLAAVTGTAELDALQARVRSLVAASGRAPYADTLPLAEASPSNLPPEEDLFVGREEDLDRLDRLLGEGSLVTLCGPGGMGKTRLALHWARSRRARFAGGAWFVELVGAVEKEDLDRAVAGVLGVPLAENPSAQLQAAIARRGPLLMILDNAEQLVGPLISRLGDWSAAAPQAAFLVTSRQRLRLDGEEAVEIGALGVDDPEAAVRLFIERAGRAVPGFSLRPGDHDAAAAIVRALDGIPLAIELAAARVRMLSLPRLLERLQERFRLLRKGPGRGGSLAATLEWSWQLLEPPEQAALAQLSVFVGSFDGEAAEAVVALDEWPDAFALDVIEGLVEKSLVRAVGRRLQFYETIRMFAASRLEGAGRTAAELRHCRWYAEWGRPELAMSLATSGLDAAPEGALASLDNLVAASRRAVEQGWVSEAQRAGFAAVEVLAYSGAVPQARALADLLAPLGGLLVRMARVRALILDGSVAEATALLEELAESLADLPSAARALVRRDLAGRWIRGGRQAEGIALATESAAGAAAEGDWAAVALAEYDIAWGEYMRGNPAGWIEAGERALEAAERDGGRRGLLDALIAAGAGQASVDVPAGILQLRRAERLAAELSVPFSRFTALNWMSRALDRSGEPERALAVMEEAHRLLQDIGSSRVADILNNSGGLMVCVGRVDEGCRRLERAAALHAEKGGVIGEMNARTNLVTAYAQVGAEDATTREAARLLELAEKVGPGATRQVRLARASAWGWLRRAADAREDLAIAAEAGAAPSPYWTGQQRLVEALVAASCGEPEVARSAIEEAATILSEDGWAEGSSLLMEVRTVAARCEEWLGGGEP